MNILYLLSKDINYKKLICHDAGPEYAASMNWKTDFFKKDYSFKRDVYYVIDNRISSQECEILKAAIQTNQSILFLPKIVDPYFYNITHYYYHFLADVAQCINVRLLSVYEPKELTLYLSSFAAHKPIHIPYAYDPSREIGLDCLNSRTKKVLISGALDQTLYPYRAAIFLKTRRSILRLFFPKLSHPGYAEMNNSNFSHNIVGDSYVNYLGKYRWMLVCGTRAEVELLKYYECAYAGCLPVGKPPSSYPDEMRELFLQIAPKNLSWSFLRMRFGWRKSKHIKTVQQIREFLRLERSADRLNEQLKSQLTGESSFYST